MSITVDLGHRATKQTNKITNKLSCMLLTCMLISYMLLSSVLLSCICYYHVCLYYVCYYHVCNYHEHVIIMYSFIMCVALNIFYIE